MGIEVRRGNTHRLVGTLIAACLVAVLHTTDPAQAAGPVTPIPAPSFDTSGWQPRPAEYGEQLTRDIPIRMSDGVVLYADLYRPTSDGVLLPGPLPAVLSQTPYNKNIPVDGLTGHSPYLVTRGYAQLVVDVRGTGSSGGMWSSFGLREQRDGLEVAEWLTSQPWSNGKFATFGASYVGVNQLLTAQQHPRGMVAAFPIVAGADVYRDVLGAGGQLDAGFIPLWLGGVTTLGTVPPAYTSTDPAAALQTLLTHANGADDFQASFLADAATGGQASYDSEFYRTRSPITQIDQVEVPTFLVGGEFDLFQRGTPMLFERLQANGVPARLLFGPWEHAEAAAVPQINGLALRWFDYYVRGVRDAALDTDIEPVTYYEQVSGQWRTARTWLPGGVKALSLKLTGSAVPSLKPGGLTRGKATAGQALLPPIPVGGVCSRSMSQWTGGALAGNPCGTYGNVNDVAGASWQTPPLKQTMRLAGPMAANLYVSTTGKDALVSVHVEDVAPDGAVTRLTGGWQTMRHRSVVDSMSRWLDGQNIQPWHPFTAEALGDVEPNRPYLVPIEVFPTGAAIPAGHRLRITVAAFDVPHMAPTVPQLLDGVGFVTVHHSGVNPSALVLPVLDQPSSVRSW